MIPVHKAPIRKPGLAVCASLVYWWIDWPKMIEWIEIWRLLGANHFYFYYQAVHKDAFYILKEYEKMVRIKKSKKNPIIQKNVFDTRK